jgi:hypothetical protein
VAGQRQWGIAVTDTHSELAEELRLLVETVLERIEPNLRRAATGEGIGEWSSCSWCPLCAAVALVRGEHHEVLAALAEHGTAMVTVLREALAGMPVDPVWPPGHDPAPRDPAQHNPAQHNPAQHDPAAHERNLADGAPTPKDGARGSAEVADSKQYKPIPVTIKT